jgi:hypothetical protein
MRKGFLICEEMHKYLVIYEDFFFFFISAVAKFRVPDWEDKVNSDIGLSYRPTRLCSLAGRYENPMPELTLSPPDRDYEFGY